MGSYIHMGWLRSVGSIKLQVSFAEYYLFYRALFQKRPIILSILLTKATPYVDSYRYISNSGEWCHGLLWTYVDSYTYGFLYTFVDSYRYIGHCGQWCHRLLHTYVDSCRYGFLCTYVDSYGYFSHCSTWCHRLLWTHLELNRYGFLCTCVDSYGYFGHCSQ